MASAGGSAQGRQVPPSGESTRTLRGDGSTPAELQRLEEELRQREAQVESLEKRLRQQQATIHAQSQTIQNPRPRASHFHETPQRQANSHLFSNNPARQATSNTTRPAGQLPSVFDSQEHVPQQSYRSTGPRGQQLSVMSSSDLGQSHHGQQGPTSTSDWGSPSPRFPRHPSGVAYTTQNHGHGSPLSAQQAQHRPNRPVQQGQNYNAITDMARNSDITPATEIKQFFERVFDMAQKYALAHVNQPNPNSDAAMPQDIKDRIIRAAPEKNAAALMNTPQTRHWLVTKIIIYWIIKNVLKVETFEGFATDIDNEVRSLRSSIYQTTPAQLRQHYLNNITTVLQRMRSRTGFQQYFERKSRDRGNMLWAIIKPMMHFKTSRDWDDLLQLMKVAHQLAEKMYTGSEEYQFSTPPVGTFFSSNTMIDKTACLSHLSAQQLQSQHATVTLAISPMVTAQGNMGTKTVIPATVMSKLPNMPG